MLRSSLFCVAHDLYRFNDEYAFESQRGKIKNGFVDLNGNTRNSVTEGPHKKSGLSLHKL